MPIRIGRGRGGLAVIVVLVVAYFVGGPEMLSLFLGGNSAFLDSPSTERSSDEDEVSQFVAAVLASTEDEWQQLFSEAGGTYVPPKLVLFSDAVHSACGFTTSVSGPFYCPPGQRVYLDTAFFGDLARMGGPGDFAQAYVIGHEVGHHVQNLLRVVEQVGNSQYDMGEASANRLQVAIELQADCYAGVWANHANRRDALLEPGDVEEGLAAAAAIGDDRMQRNSGSRVRPIHSHTVRRLSANNG
jgi:predicted metalloprotease